MKVFISGDGPRNEIRTWLKELDVEITSNFENINGKGVEGAYTSVIRQSDIVLAHHPTSEKDRQGILPLVVAKQEGIKTYLFISSDSNFPILDKDRSALPHLVEIRINKNG